MSEGRPSVEAAEKALVRKPRIGDTRPMPAAPPPGPATAPDNASTPSAGARSSGDRKRRRRGGGSGGAAAKGDAKNSRAGTSGGSGDAPGDGSGAAKKNRRGRGRGRSKSDGPELDDAMLEQRKGRERNGKPIGRYFMAVQVRSGMTQVAVLEGRSLIEHYVSRPADDVSQIHGNIYVGRIQNVLPGMEAAFVDIATPKNAVLYRGDVQYDAEDIVEGGRDLRIEDILKNKQIITCQVTKNPIAHKGARLTQEVSLPGRFVVLIPNSKTYGISKRLPDDVRKRLRGILDRVKPAEHGLIVRTAAETATEEELVADMTLLLGQWEQVAAKAATTQRPALLYREPEMAVRVIREEFNANYRGVVIDDERSVPRSPRLRCCLQPGTGRPDRVLRRRRRGWALAVREVPHPRAGPQGARSQSVAAVGWLADHRAHRGAHRDRRQHRQERRQVEPRRDRVPQQHGSRGRDRQAACGCATSAGSS